MIVIYLIMSILHKKVYKFELFILFSLNTYFLSDEMYKIFSFYYPIFVINEYKIFIQYVLEDMLSIPDFSQVFYVFYVFLIIFLCSKFFKFEII